MNETKKILIIDDDKEMHLLFESFMGDIDEYELTLCINFDDALDELKRAKGNFDLILTDLVIEGAHYKANVFTAKVHETYPDMKVILFTGFVRDEVCSNYRDFCFVDKLEKPFRRNDLLECINATLAVDAY